MSGGWGLVLLAWLQVPAFANPISIQVPEPPPELFQRRVALVVGVDHYDNIDDLEFAAKDASDIADVLGAEDWGDFEVFEYSGRLERDQFWDAFKDATRGLNRDDVFVLYFAGHGSLKLIGTQTQFFLLPSDADYEDLWETAIPLEELQGRLKGLQVERRVLIMDACHNPNSQGRSRAPEEVQRQLEGARSDAVPPPIEIQPGRSEVRLFAAEKGQIAQEAPELENGVYTHYLVQALQPPDTSDSPHENADLNGDGGIDVWEAHSWAAKETRTFTANTQWPLFEGEATSLVYLARPAEFVRPPPTGQQSTSPGNRGGEETSGDSAQIWLSVGPQWRSDPSSTVTVPWSVSEELGLSMSSGLWLSARSSQAVGGSQRLNAHLTHTLTGETRIGWRWGDRFSAAPYVGLGLRLHLWDDRPLQAGLYAPAGVDLRWNLFGGFLGLAVGGEGVPMQSAAPHLRLLPTASLGGGMIF